MIRQGKKTGVLFILNSLVSGGAERHVISLLERLPTELYRLSLTYLTADETLLSQVPKQRLEALWGCKVSQKLDFTTVNQLAKRIDDLEIDVVVCTNQYSALYGWLARQCCKRKIKLVEVFHTTVLLSKKERIQMLLYRQLFRQCDLLIYVCRNQRDYWASKGLQSRAEAIIHNGIDIQHHTDNFNTNQKLEVRSRFGFGSQQYLVGICAALRPEKAHVDFVAAVSRLRAHNIDAVGLIIGDGPERAHIEASIRLARMEDYISISGFQSDVRPYVAACDTMALVSHGVETFSLSALEAMSMGKPMVMTDIGGANEQIVSDEYGLLYKPGDIETLVEHLSHFSHESTRLSASYTARKYVADRFTIDAMVDAYSQAFTALV